MHLDAYVANLVPFDASNESIALINPTVPIDISSSISLLGIKAVERYYYQKYTQLKIHYCTIIPIYYQ